MYREYSQINEKLSAFIPHSRFRLREPVSMNDGLIQDRTRERKHVVRQSKKRTKIVVIDVDQ